jgi:hypothetical protein
MGNRQDVYMILISRPERNPVFEGLGEDRIIILKDLQDLVWQHRLFCGSEILSSTVNGIG